MSMEITWITAQQECANCGASVAGFVVGDYCPDCGWMFDNEWDVLEMQENQKEGSKVADGVLRPGAVIKTELAPDSFQFWLESPAGKLPLAIVVVTDASAQWSHLFSRALGHWLKNEDCMDPFDNLEQMQEMLEHFCTAMAEQYSYGAVGTRTSMSNESEVWNEASKVADELDAAKRQVAELKQENSNLKAKLAGPLLKPCPTCHGDWSACGRPGCPTCASSPVDGWVLA